MDIFDRTFGLKIYLKPELYKDYYLKVYVHKAIKNVYDQ